MQNNSLHSVERHKTCPFPIKYDSVNLVELGLLKFGRCHHCCISVKGAKCKETGFGCRTCVKHLCHSGCHEQYHRQKNIF
ncbi:hypothetical protein ABFA07_015408 [Porites harrisoni]